MKLKRVGFFQELDHGDPNGPKLAEHVSDRPQPDEARVVDYLRSGLLLIGCPGVVHDVLDNKVGPVGSPDVLTDGVWAWPGDLPYYVEKYHLRLPKEFVDHLRGRSFRPPAEREVDIRELEL